MTTQPPLHPRKWGRGPRIHHLPTSPGTKLLHPQKVEVPLGHHVTLKALALLLQNTHLLAWKKNLRYVWPYYGRMLLTATVSHFPEEEVSTGVHSSLLLWAICHPGCIVQCWAGECKGSMPHYVWPIYSCCYFHFCRSWITVVTSTSLNSSVRHNHTVTLHLLWWEELPFLQVFTHLS